MKKLKVIWNKIKYCGDKLNNKSKKLSEETKIDINVLFRLSISLFGKLSQPLLILVFYSNNLANSFFLFLSFFLYEGSIFFFLCIALYNVDVFFLSFLLLSFLLLHCYSLSLMP